MKNKIFILLFIFLGLVSCGKINTPTNNLINPGESSNLEENEDSFGENLDNSGIYDGEFEGESNIVINCVSGTKNAYTIENDTVTFKDISIDSVYSICGNLNGNIIINISQNCKFELEMQGLSIISNNINPITILNGDKVTLTAKKETKNYIYDYRDVIDENDSSLYNSAIYSKCDLKLGGKGEMNVVSKNNNGIHSKDDIEVKNLTLKVVSIDNALKGNDGVTIESGNIKLISSKGDCIKTTNSHISDKGNQKGTVTILDGNIELYAACDGIDAAYNVDINGGNLNIYTDKYSNYSSEIISTSEGTYYIKTSTDSYQYSIKYYNNDNDYLWVNSTYHSSYRDGRTNYFYYNFDKKSEYSKLKIYTYKQTQELAQENEYVNSSEYLSINDKYDTIQIKNNAYSWTNYTTQSRPGGFGGPGGMNEGNSDKKDYSTKGIKASNQIMINNGNISIKSYDDGIHVNNDETLENGESPLGNINIEGGTIAIYSNDDGIHADGSLIIENGNINIFNSYEGLEGNTVNIVAGYVSIVSKDDGINATTTTGEAVVIDGGINYIYCSGDGIDSNSRTSYSGIIFNNGKTVVISNSNGNSAIDTESGYKFNGGRVVAIMPNGGMSNEATHCQNFSSIGTKKSINLTLNSYLVINDEVNIKMPCNINGLVIYLGDNNCSISSSSNISNELDNNGVYWK